MVEGGSTIAASFGISERVIGLTVVAIGTSLPELAASVAGALKGYPELAVGNVVGSCLFNLTFVLGASSMITPLSVDLVAMRWDLAIMGGLTVLMWGMFFTGLRMSRWEGVGLVLGYAGFLTWLVITTAQSMGAA
jgi:cation:H+ antiporter